MWPQSRSTMHPQPPNLCPLRRRSVTTTDTVRPDGATFAMRRCRRSRGCARRNCVAEPPAQILRSVTVNGVEPFTVPDQTDFRRAESQRIAVVFAVTDDPVQPDSLVPIAV